MKCAEANHVRCCGVSVEKMVGTATTLSSVSNAEPETTTTEFVSDKQDEQTTTSADESIEIHPTELDTFETATFPVDDENTIAYVYGARNEDALRELTFDDGTTDGSIDENQPVTESTQLPVAQDENVESVTENGQEITTFQAEEISTEEKQQSAAVEAVSSTSTTTEHSFVRRTKNRVENTVRRRYTNYRQRNSDQSQMAEAQASNDQSLVIIEPSAAVKSTSEQPEKVEEAKFSVTDRDPEVNIQTMDETGTERILPSVHPVQLNHGMMIMKVHSLLSNFMKEVIPLTKEEHIRQLNELKQNGATPIIQTKRRKYGRPVNRFQLQTSSEGNQEIENVTQSELVTTTRPKYQKTKSIPTNISAPVTSIPLESLSSTVRYSKRKQYSQRRNPNGISTTLRTNSNENLVTVTESMPMTEDEKKQIITNKRKMLFAARRGPPVRTTTTPNTLDTDKTTEKVIPITKVKASRSKHSKRRYNMRVKSSTEQKTVQLLSKKNEE